MEFLGSEFHDCCFSLSLSLPLHACVCVCVCVLAPSSKQDLTSLTRDKTVPLAEEAEALSLNHWPTSEARLQVASLLLSHFFPEVGSSIFSVNFPVRRKMLLIQAGEYGGDDMGAITVLHYT